MNAKNMVAGLVVGMLSWNSSFAAVSETINSMGRRQAVVINASELLNQSTDLRGEITRGLQDQKVLSELANMGIKKGEVEMRLAAMSDQELRQVQQGVQRQAGGDVVVISVTTLLIGIIILILLLR